tara:strand:+ start:943 stop:1311 length:369 start_codon:yes stop_codon:yes gene_type:complete
MWEWVKDTASTAWNWATSNITPSNVYEAVRDFSISDRISGDERAALLAAQARDRRNDPSLSGYKVNASRSTAGVSGYGDIQEATGTKYAQLLYYTKQYLKSKQQFEGSVPSITYKKSGLGSR